MSAAHLLAWANTGTRAFRAWAEGLDQRTRIAVLITIAGFLLTSIWSWDGIARTPTSCQSVTQFPNAADPELYGPWHECYSGEGFGSTEGGGYTFGPDKIDYYAMSQPQTYVSTQVGMLLFDEAERRFWIGLLATGLAVGGIIGQGWVARGRR